MIPRRVAALSKASEGHAQKTSRARGDIYKAIGLWLLVVGLGYVILVIGTHGWRIGYFPRFSQTEVLSDILWIICVGALCGIAVALVLVAAPLGFGAFLPGSVGDEERARSKPMSEAQLTLVGLLCVICIPLYAMLNIGGLPPEVKEYGAFCALGIYAVMLLRNIEDLMRPGDGALGVHISKKWWKKLRDSSLSWRERIQEPRREVARCFYFFVLLAILSTSTYFFAGKVGGILLVGASPYWPIGAMVMPVVLGIGHLAALRLSYFDDARTKMVATFVLPVVAVFLLVLLAPLVLSAARLGNLTQSTILVDSKFLPALELVGKPKKLNESVAAMEADVVLAFGADIILASPGTFQTTSTCKFDFFLASRNVTRVASMGRDSKTSPNAQPISTEVSCIALPRSAIYALM